MAHDEPTRYRAEVRNASQRFWAWRAAQQPQTGDDIARIDRPPGWTPGWSREAVAAHRRTLDGFEAHHRSLRNADAPIPDQVDQRLLESAAARVRWELDIVRTWQRDPRFYLDQTLGVIFVLLLRPPPFDSARADALLTQLRAVPRVLVQGRENLTEYRCGELTRITVEDLRGAGESLRAAMDDLRPFLPAAARAPLTGLARQAAEALDRFGRHLRDAPTAVAAPPVGDKAFRWFLTRVACLSSDPERLVAIGRQELARAELAERLERRRNLGRPSPAPCRDAAEQIARHRRDELDVRAFCEERGLLTQPASLRHYLAAPMPSYLAPLVWLGVSDDLTGPHRLTDDAVTYLPAPGANPSYFDALNTLDPRLGIIHEGVHYQQLAMSWAHPDPVRRHFYDSTANEGIAFYNEELMLRAGLFDASPAAREAVYAMARLRASRVEADIGLATGALGIGDAVTLLRASGGLSEAEALREAAFFRSVPGQGMSYQIGKTQLIELAAAAMAAPDADGDALRHLHDHVWRNGNVPLTLTRWEYLRLPDQKPPLDDSVVPGD